ncbi:MAG TPA: 4-hydroxybenzoate 3-monooxygenase [Mycobacteriales bacterium]|nr:4-hydroxybenzoate 3-monooxygenase [Mycobacteriales bacterium]
MASDIRTRVAIVGAGPAGLMLAILLQRRGVDCVIMDKFEREQILGRMRAGMLEHRTVALIDELGLGARLHAEGKRHDGCEFRSGGDSFYIDYSALYDNTPQFVYPQQELVADLIEAFEKAGGKIHFGERAVGVTSLTDQPVVTTESGLTVAADFVAGCDGQHGVVRPCVPDGVLTKIAMQHEFRWLTLLAQTPPSAHWTIYAQHPRGFAGHLLRSSTITRFHMQVPFGDTVDDWPDDRIWEELRARFEWPGWVLNEGPVVSKNMLEMESHVHEPMQYGRVFLVGDAAHIITPSGGKGMNLAIADAAELDKALAAFDESGGDESVLTQYSERRIPDIWKAQDFSRYLIDMIHTYDPAQPGSAFRQKLQQSRLWQLKHSATYARSFAESFIGPPLGWPTEKDLVATTTT